MLSETEHRGGWHRYHAQLGYALKDSGEIREALIAFNKAIEQWKRGTDEPVSPHYQFNWVYCQVRIDNEERDDGQVSDADMQAAVKKSLEGGSSFPALAQAMREDDAIKSWLERNSLDWSCLELSADP